MATGERRQRIAEREDTDAEFLADLENTPPEVVKELRRLRTALGESIEAMQAEEDVQAAALGCDECDGGEYCEVHIEQAILSAEKRRAALAAARAVGVPGGEKA